MKTSRDEVFSLLLIYFFGSSWKEKVSTFLDMFRVAQLDDQNSFENKNCISVYFSIRFKLKQWICFQMGGKT